MGRDVNIPIEDNSRSISNGFGNLTIPIDKTREAYLRDFYRTGHCMLITMFNEVKRDVSIPKHIVDQCEFPDIPGGKGSLVHWTRVPGTGQLVVTGIHFTSSDLGSSSQKVKTSATKTCDGGIKVTRDLESGEYQISVQGSSTKSGSIVFTVSDGEHKSRLLLHGGGLTILESSGLSLVLDELTIKIDKDKKIVFDQDEIDLQFNSERIRLTKDSLEISTEKVISLRSNDSSLSITEKGIVVETESQIYLEGQYPALYSKVSGSEEIVDLRQIGVAKKVKLG